MRLKCLAFVVMIASIAVAAEDEQPMWGGDDDSFSPSNADYLGQESTISNVTDSQAQSDEVIDTILETGRQGRNLDGFDEVYSDPSVQEALQKGDDAEARNVIRDKLCDLGLMDCSVQEKRPYYGPPPPPGYNRKPPVSPPYGVPRPMPPPGAGGNKYNGPPRKVGYAYGPGPVYQSKPQSPPLPPIYEGPNPPGPIYQGPTSPGGIFGGNVPPYKFVNGNEQFQEKFEFDSHGLQKPTIVGGVNGQSSGAASTVNIHHHYHHLDNEAGKTGPNIVKQSGPQFSSGNSLSSGEYSSNSFTSGGFSPVSAGYDFKKQQQSNSFKGGASSGFGGFTGGVNSGLGPVNSISGNGIYGVPSKPIFEPTNSLVGASGPGLYATAGSAAVSTQYGGQSSGLYNTNMDSFHSSNPDYYKKALNTNSALPNYLQSYSQALYTPQYNGQFGTNSLASNPSGAALKPQYNGPVNNQQVAQNFGQQQSTYNTGENIQQLAGSSSYQALDCVCVPYEQCPSYDIIGRKGDLILPLDPRHLETEIEALEDGAVVTDGNGTMTIVRVAKNIKLAGNATTTGTIVESVMAGNQTESDGKTKKIVKRDVGAEKQADAKADGEGVSIYFSFFLRFGVAIILSCTLF